MKPILLHARLVIRLTLAAFTVGLAGGCAGDRYHQSTGEHIDDGAISMRIKNALSDDPQFKFPMVEVKTFKGTAQLSGFVNTKEQKSRAAEIANRVSGVRSVENNISIKE